MRVCKSFVNVNLRLSYVVFVFLFLQPNNEICRWCYLCLRVQSNVHGIQTSCRTVQSSALYESLISNDLKHGKHHITENWHFVLVSNSENP